MLQTIHQNLNFYRSFTSTYTPSLRIVKRSIDIHYNQNLTIL